MSDIALKRPLPPEISENLLAYVGCVAGAIPVEEYRRGLLEAGFAHVEIVDSGSDLNAYTQIEGQSGCCSPAAAEPAQSACCSPAATAESKELPVAQLSCCTPSPEAESSEGLGELLRRYDVNEFAASVKVYAVKA